LFQYSRKTTGSPSRQTAISPMAPRGLDFSPVLIEQRNAVSWIRAPWRRLWARKALHSLR
jgi:hypothetical protein